MKQTPQPTTAIGTSTKLKLQLWTAVVIAVAIVVVFETETIMPGALYGDRQAQFIAETVMTLLALALIPTALYLFKLRHVSDQLHSADGETQLLRWGIIRLDMLCVPMVTDIALYYLYAEDVRFFYLAVINALCLFMVYPTSRRCMTETAEEEYQDTDTDENDDKQ